MDQIFDLTYYGNGGFTFEQVYAMPVNVRSYYYAKLVRIKEIEKETIEQSKSKKGGR